MNIEKLKSKNLVKKLEIKLIFDFIISAPL